MNKEKTKNYKEAELKTREMGFKIPLQTQIVFSYTTGSSVNIALPDWLIFLIRL